MPRIQDNVLVGGYRVFANGRDIGYLQGEAKVSETKSSTVIKECEGGAVKTINTDKEVHMTFGLLEADLDVLRQLNPSYSSVIRGESVVAVVSEFIADIGKISALKHYNIDETSTIKVVPATTLKVTAQESTTSIYVQNARRFAAADTIAIVRGATVETKTVDSVNATTGEIELAAPLVNGFPSGTMVKITTSAKEMQLGVDYNMLPSIGQTQRVSTSTDVLNGDSAAIDYSYLQGNEEGIASGSFEDSTPYKVEFWHKKNDKEARCVRFHKATLSGEFSPMIVKNDGESPIPIDFSAMADETIADTKKNIYEIVDLPISAAPGGGW